MPNNNSGTPSAEEIQKMEKDLDTEAADSLKETEQKPSEFETEDEDDDPKPHKKDKKKVDDIDEDEEEDEDEDEDDGDIEDDDVDDDDEDEEDEDDKSKDKKVPAWMVKMQERRLNQAVEQARAEERAKFEKEHGRKPDADEKKELDDDLAVAFKKEFGIEPDENTAKFLKFLEKRVSPKLSTETAERITKIEQAALEKAEELGFEKDFSSQKKLLEKYFPDADSKALDRIKGKVKELAYTEKYAKYSLDDIIRLNRKALAPVDRKKTGEASRGGAGQARYTADQLDPEKIDWDSLSIEEAEKVMSALEKQQGKKSRVTIYRKGKRIN